MALKTELGSHACEARTLLAEPLLQSAGLLFYQILFTLLEYFNLTVYYLFKHTAVQTTSKTSVWG